MRAALSKIEGVDSVEVDFKAKTATIKMTPGKPLTSEDCTKALADTNYKVASFETAGG